MRSRAVVVSAVLAATFHVGASPPEALRKEQFAGTLTACLRPDEAACQLWLANTVLARYCVEAAPGARISLAPELAVGGGVQGWHGFPCTEDLAKNGTLPETWDRATVRKALEKVMASNQSPALRRLIAALVCLDRTSQSNVPKCLAQNLEAPSRSAGGSEAWWYEPALLLLTAQSQELAGNGASSARIALELIERFPLDRRVLAARLIVARQLARAGKFEDSLRELREVQRASSDWPEVAESRRLAALAWSHWQSEAHAKVHFKPSDRVVTVDREKTGTVTDLAISEDGTVVVTGNKGAVYASSDGSVRSLRTGVDCTGASFAHDGRLLMACDRDLAIMLRRPASSAGDGRFEADARWKGPLGKWNELAKTTRDILDGARRPRWDTNASIWLFNDSEQSVMSFRSEAGYAPGFEVKRMEELTTTATSPVAVIPPEWGNPSWFVRKKPGDAGSFIATNSPPDGWTKHKLDATAINLTKVFAAASDEFGWIYLVGTLKKATVLMAVEPRSDGGLDVIARQDIELKDPVALTVSSSGEVLVANEDARVLAFRLGSDE